MGYLMGGYEQETSSLLAELYEDDVILDVGANIGLVALPLAVRTKPRTTVQGPHVYAFEALSSNFQVLCENIALNDLGGAVKPLNVGIGADERDVFIQIEGDDPLRTGTANVLPSSRDFVKVPLRTVAIDQLVTRGEAPQENLSDEGRYRRIRLRSAQGRARSAEGESTAGLCRASGALPQLARLRHRGRRFIPDWARV
jgi:FkbM family methyltransferase